MLDTEGAVANIYKGLQELPHQQWCTRSIMAFSYWRQTQESKKQNKNSLLMQYYNYYAM